MKPKTLDDLEAENPDGFCNPEPTAAEEARYQRQWEAMRTANESLPDVPEVEEEDEEEEEEEEETPDDE